jgi:predicted dehydrogenase
MNQIIIPSRRSFLKSAAAVSAVSSIAAPGIVLGNPDSRKLKIGLVGCGGRGSGAAGDAMTADSNAELWAAGDVFPSSIEGSLSALRNQFKDRVNVEDSRKFTGMDAYQKVLESGVDVVILATPPGFRPIHFEAAVNAGKHIFCEKPVAVDMAGVKKVMAAAQKAKEKGLAVVSGFCWRKDTSRREFFKRIHAGDIGDISHYYATYYTGPVKSMARKEDRKPE